MLLPLALARCGESSSDTGEAHAGAAGTAGASTQGGEAGALGGAIEVGGAADEAGDTGSGGQAEGGAAGSGAGSDMQGLAGSGACGEKLLTFTDPSARHVTECSPITYPMNPPVYGDHYPFWALYKSYSVPVPLGFLVHDLEHGAVVLLYNCPDGCADEVAVAQALLDALPQDPRCTAEVKHQTILSPDPTLPTRWATVAWGHSLTADCFDTAAVRGFYDANVGRGPEDSCSEYNDVSGICSTPP